MSFWDMKLEREVLTDRGMAPEQLTRALEIGHQLLDGVVDRVKSVEFDFDGHRYRVRLALESVDGEDC